MSETKVKTVLIIGAGPAGLTAALELLRNTDIRPIVLEASNEIGGISRTVNFQGYRMDLGGHRFFSKSDWVMNWWLNILPLESVGPGEAKPVMLSYHNQHRALPARTKPVDDVKSKSDQVMLLRDRLSRIYFRKKLFDYPIKLNLRSIVNLGPWSCLKIAASLAWSKLFARRQESSLEDFLINRFGGELYRTFFRSYTEKVWGVPCSEISAEWGAQRIKGVSLLASLRHSLKQLLPSQARQTPTSLIERFLYPRLGPGQLWERVADQIRELGGEIRLSHRVEGLALLGGAVTRVTARDVQSNVSRHLEADWVISTMAVSDLIAAISPSAPCEVRRVASGLPYRNFITVGVIVRRMKRRSGAAAAGETWMLPDNWIYIQEPDVKLGRLQIFNNWSDDLVPDPQTVWLGLEYFCSDGDELWSLSDSDMQALAVQELIQIDLVDPQDILDATVIRVPKAYPAYFGTHAELGTVRSYVDRISNLFLIGRNGMHRYNNQDHSMLTAKAAVELIVSGCTSRDSIWDINVDDDYHESRPAQESESKHSGK